jgi:hypothetical protein
VTFKHCLYAARRGLGQCEILHELGDYDPSRLTTWGDAIARGALYLVGATAPLD